MTALLTRFLDDIRCRGWLHGILYMGLGMLMWAIVEDIAHFFSQPYASFEIVWVRYLVHLLFMLAVLGPVYRRRLIRTQRLGWQSLRAVLMLGMHLTFIFAVKSISVSQTMSIFWLTPLLVLLLAWLTGERIHWRIWLATLLAYGGVWVLLEPAGGLAWRASALSVGMALSFSLYLMLSRWLRHEDILASLFYTALGCWLILGLGLPFYWHMPTLQDVLLMAAIGLVGFVGIYGFDKAMEAAPAAVVAPFTLTQPVFTVLVDFLMLGRVPYRHTLVGAGIILSSAIFLGYCAEREAVRAAAGPSRVSQLLAPYFKRFGKDL